jgi:ferredoxin
MPGANRVNTYVNGEFATSIVLRRGPPQTISGSGLCWTARQRARRTGRAERMAVKLLHDGILHEVLGMAFVITEPCMDVMDQACIRVCPVACIHSDAGKDRKLYIDPDECIDCGACEPVCPVKAIYADFELPAQWRAYADIDALWYRDKEAARARVAAMKDGR